MAHQFTQEQLVALTQTITANVRAEFEARLQQATTNNSFLGLAEAITEANKTQAEEIAKLFKDSARNRETYGKDPAKFDGTFSDARRFLIQIQTFFAGNEHKYDEDEKKLAYAFSLLTGKAAEWATPIQEVRLLTEQVDDATGEDLEALNARVATLKPYMIETWDDFEKSFVQMWFSKNDAHDAQNEIKRCTQGKGTVVDYSVKFGLLAARTAYDDQALMSLFRDGLSLNIKNVIGGWDREYKSYTDIRDAALKAEQNIAEFTGQRGQYNPVGRTHNTGSTFWRGNQTTSNAVSMGEPMDIGGTPKIDIPKGTRVCFNCYGRGHLRSECTNPKKPFHYINYVEPTKRVAATTAEYRTKEASAEEGSAGSSHAALMEQMRAMSIKVGQLAEVVDKKKDF